MLGLLLACKQGGSEEEEADVADVRAAEKPQEPPADEAAPSDEVLAEQYQAARKLLTSDVAAAGDSAKAAVARATADLQRIANTAEDRHLRANAALLLGSWHEQQGQSDAAIGYYRHATKLVPDDAGPAMALALALTADKRYPEAIEVQKRVVELDPDNLENWLALAEMHIKAGDEQAATEAYARYEMRRRGLLEGLTGKEDGAYQVDPQERAGCALALASAGDTGTAMALIYALQSEPEAQVREAIAKTMGLQRFQGYLEPLQKQLEGEQNPEVRKMMKWAISEIERDPVETKPDPLERGE